MTTPAATSVADTLGVDDVTPTCEVQVDGFSCRAQARYQINLTCGHIDLACTVHAHVPFFVPLRCTECNAGGFAEDMIRSVVPL